MQSDIKATLDVLRNGGLILYPTDTIWGIGCDATNADAVERLSNLKQRKSGKNMLVLIENPNMLNIYLEEVPEIAWDLIEVADKPLTIIYPKARNFAPNLIADDGSIGIRVVRHTFCERLLQAFRKPIVSTSANISGHAFPKSFGDIAPEIIAGVDLVVPQTYEEILSPMPSGIIQLGLGGEVKVIRE
ncbi:L-threonylcarbamoyladenylate synthase [Perlabentimonas gracilis]|uniref:L-threonylcarbamoyladenylate synthase n=1 Tax=Perlabentimonas gracilis TaxID=2715279 RepID=UPI00140CDCED|nr:L-threonylcarbamoyladenylate synthase [Perlabentimonas gracilis]NHB67878.1 threonylcarbamoyl-AMP synthase [Perlabentimonas gracilis]